MGMLLEWPHKFLHSPSVCSALIKRNPESCIAHGLLRHEALPEEINKDSTQSPAVGYIIITTYTGAVSEGVQRAIQELRQLNF